MAHRKWEDRGQRNKLLRMLNERQRDFVNVKKGSLQEKMQQMNKAAKKALSEMQDDQKGPIP